MQGAIKSGTGSRLESEVWKYFKFDAVASNSTCQTFIGDKPCNKSVSGKYTTNLRNHLQSFYKYEYDLFMQRDSAFRKASQTKKSSSATSTDTGTNKGMPNIESGAQRKPLWDLKSVEEKLK